VPTREKIESVETLKTRLAGAKAVVLTEYRGLTVQQLSELRKQLKAAASEYKVVKNRLAQLAIQGSLLGELGPHLKGPTGLALSKQNPVALAKTLQAFVRTHPALQIKLGYAEGKLLQPTDLKTLADLPSREVLLGQVIGGLQAPIAAFVNTLEGMLRALISALDQIGAQKATLAGSESSEKKEESPNGSSEC
jgi:large subunit ribosomal protein L10